jgi:hypothetical protein
VDLRVFCTVFCTPLIADSLDLTGQTDVFELHILHSLHYNSDITIETNECAQFYRARNITYYNTPAAACCRPYWSIVREPTMLQNSCVTFCACSRGAVCHYPITVQWNILAQIGSGAKCRMDLTFESPCIVIHFFSKTNQMHQFLKFVYFWLTLYMFRTVFPSVIRSSRLYLQQQVYVKQILLSR